MNIFSKILQLTALGALSVVPYTAYAQAQNKKPHEFNWSLNISNSKDSVKCTYFNLGLLSNLGQQKGSAINVVSNVVHHDMYGFQLSGILSYTGRNMSGLQIGGLASVVKNNSNGMMVSGLMNAAGGNANGLQLSGVANVTGKKFNGFSIGGFMNFSSKELNGAQLSGILNASGGQLKGLQLSLLSNVGVEIDGVQSSLISNISAKKVKGLQLSSVTNIALDVDKAVQLSSLSNICMHTMDGVQLALGNYAEHVKGVQLGFLNLSTGKATGWQVGIINHSKDSATHKIGLINTTPQTRKQVLFWGGNTSKINLAIRFKNKNNYSILGLGTHYFDLNDKFSGSLFYRTGLYYPIWKKFEISGDLGYAHIENFENENAEIPERMYSLQARLNGEYRILKKLGVFASVGYAMTRYYKKNKLFENKPIVELGVVLL